MGRVTDEAALDRPHPPAVLRRGDAAACSPSRWSRRCSRGPGSSARASTSRRRSSRRPATATATWWPSASRRRSTPTSAGTPPRSSGRRTRRRSRPSRSPSACSRAGRKPTWSTARSTARRRTGSSRVADALVLVVGLWWVRVGRRRPAVRLRALGPLEPAAADEAGSLERVPDEDIYEAVGTLLVRRRRRGRARPRRTPRGRRPRRPPQPRRGRLARPRPRRRHRLSPLGSWCVVTDGVPGSSGNSVTCDASGLGSGVGTGPWASQVALVHRRDDEEVERVRRPGMRRRA